MKKNYIRPCMRIIILRHKQNLLIGSVGSGDRYYKEEKVNPEDAIWSEMVVRFSPPFLAITPD